MLDILRWALLGMLALSVLTLACSNSGGTNNGSKCTATSPCASGGFCRSSRDCPADAGFVCHNSVCAGPCTTDANCAAGEVCGTIDTRKMCLRECVNGACPASDAGCEIYWADRKSVCATRAFANACSSVEDPTACTISQCGPRYSTEWCVTTDYYCPHNGPCDPTLANTIECTCETGSVATACDGTPCDQTDCHPGEWACVPSVLPSSSCADEPHQSSGNCHCADGRVLPFVCGETSSCEDRCATGCDIMKQDCPDPGTPKCTYLESIPIGSYDVDFRYRARPICVALTGTKKLGEPCTQSTGPDGGPRLGLDDCDKGLFCAEVGNPAGTRVCTPVCTGNDQCGDGGMCELMIDAYPEMGACRQSCSLGGTECGAGRSCALAFSVEWRDLPYCKYDGPGGAGSPCTYDTECKPGQTCSGRTGTCRQTCSSTIPCDGGTCMSDPYNPAATEGYSLCY